MADKNRFIFDCGFVLIVLVSILKITECVDDDYNVLHNDGSFEFGSNSPDSYHYADGNRNNVVKGEFGARNPGTGAIDSTIYTAGPRGYRPRGKNIHRKYDLNQNGRRPVGSRDDPYYDPYEDPSYNFSFRTRTYNRDESANRVGDVNGRYSYLDDVGERHNVEFIAGAKTGFHVKTPFPDSNPRGYGPLYFNGRGKPIPRGRTSVQRGVDGSYKFVSAGPDQRRTETADATGHVRGSYTYLDDKGVQHSVHYIAGPETGYRVLKNVKGPHLPTVFPFGRPGIIPPDFYDYNGREGDLFDTAASGSPVDNNVDNNLKPGKDEVNFDTGIDVNKDDFNKFNNDASSTTPFPPRRPARPQNRPGVNRPYGANRPSYSDDGDESDFDLFGGVSGGSSTTAKPYDDGQYRPSSTERTQSSSTTSRPSDGGFISLDGGGDYGSRPRPGATVSTSATSSSTPNYGNDGDGYSSTIRPSNRPSGRPRPTYEDDFSIFGSESHGSHFGISEGTDGYGSNCPKCRGTVVTNVGYNTFSVPPGVSVRAHVQAIDLFPVSDVFPSPSEQFRADMGLKTEQLNEAPTKEARATTTKNADSSEEVTTTVVPTTTSNSTSA
ncbi:unnamed protein product [Brassicogethes aeneus]|uniref:Uncharacterized protein n=1 Tax=Brassicogethes aeneus TaxID=1431903 RepID=A0A9P0B9V4_BRAAE|nr:unnamed protein product [Brassicogethes aeneus]